jgi:hypothetical protein
VHDVLRAPGRSLDQDFRTEMEGRLGADLSGVRIHTDAVARRSAAELDARAYTSGDHVVVGEGGADRQTMAHELVHVIQQRRGPVAGTDNGRGLRISDAADRFEREAEKGTHALSVPPGGAAGEGATVVQRAPRRKDQGEAGQHTHVDPDYPGLRLIEDTELTDRYKKYGQTIYQIEGTEKRVLFDSDASIYVKADEDLDTFGRLADEEIRKGDAQENLTGLFNPLSSSTYHYKAGNLTIRPEKINKIAEFYTYGIRSGELVEVRLDLLQAAQQRLDLESERVGDVMAGFQSGAAIAPVEITLDQRGIDIAAGNHRLQAAFQSGYEYVPCVVL